MTITSHIPYLERRRAGFFFRRRLPRTTKISSSEKTPKPFLFLSLRTHVPADAKDIARSLTALCDSAFALMTERMMDHLSADQILILETLARFQISAHEKLRASAPPRSEDAATAAAALEQANQTALRRALALGDREHARAPLQEVARHLGLPLAEDTTDWNRLAYEAVRLLLDLSAQRELIELGQYQDPSPIFRSIRAKEANQPEPSRAPGLGGYRIALPAVSAALRMDMSQAPRPAADLPSSDHIVPPAPIPAREPHQSPNQHALAPANSSPEREQAVEPDCAMHLDAETQRRVALRPPALGKLPMKRLTPRMQSILSTKPRGISVLEAIDLFEEVKTLGLGDEFGRKQVPNEQLGAKWMKDSGSKLNFARRFWPEFVGDEAFEEASEQAISDALEFLPQIPAKHSKGTDKWAPTMTFADVVERCELENEEERRYRISEVKKKPGATQADLEAAENYRGEPRLRTATIVKHRRLMPAIGRMLLALNLIDINPFEACSVTNKEEKRMAQNEPDRVRTVWDDRIYDLFKTPVFQGQTDDVGDPMFWAPLIARTMGLREEEILQLSPDDFKTDRGIPFIEVMQWEGNYVKSTTSQRKVPVYPGLIDLGLLRLVELCRAQKQPRLFPNLKRGKSKGKFSELFTKNFNYYRVTNAVYWPGLDFHAFRTSFNSDLMNRDKSDAIRCIIMGHELKDEGARSYGQGVLLETLLTRMGDVHLDLSKVVSPFTDKIGKSGDRAAKAGLRLVS